MLVAMPTIPPPLPSPLAAERFDLDVHGVRIACYRAGPDAEADDRAVVPLLLVHSVNAAASAFEIKPLFDHYRCERTVYALDLPGYGLSDRSDRFYSLRLMTDAVAAVVDAIGLRHAGVPVDAIAVSLASEYLARAAVERPERHRSVGLVSATGLDRRIRRGPPGATRGKPGLMSTLGRAPGSAGLLRLLTKPGVIRYFLEKTWGSKGIDEGLLAYDIVTTRQPGAQYAPFHFLSAFLFCADVTRLYESLGMPTLLVHGTRGDFVDYRGADRLVRDHGWRRHVMQAGALPYFEDLSDFTAAYARFLADIDGAVTAGRLPAAV